MLKEFHQVKQEAGARRRRWFEDDVAELELIVWLDQGDAIDGFQICYNLGRGEYALTWKEKVGFAHDAVDTGSKGPFANLTPILVPDGRVPWHRLHEFFSERSASLDPKVRDLIEAKLTEGESRFSHGFGKN